MRERREEEETKWESIKGDRGRERDMKERHNGDVKDGEEWAIRAKVKGA